MICSSGVGFDPVIDGHRYQFDVAGLYDGLFVMMDRTTGSIWTHFDGTILTGPLAGTGTALAIQPLFHRRWKDWVAEHPDTLVMAWNDAYADSYWNTRPGEPGLGRQFLDTIRSLDDRLPENELVLGVDTGTGSRAYVLSDDGGLVVMADEVGGVPIVVVMEPDSVFGIAFAATLDGEVLVFDTDDAFVDASGTAWNLDGSSDDGRQLTFVTSFVTEWYGWAAYHPDTDIAGS